MPSTATYMSPRRKSAPNTSHTSQRSLDNTKNNNTKNSKYRASEEFTRIPVSPPPSLVNNSGSHSSPARHSPTLESIQKFASKTVFSSKLFKRSANNNKNDSHSNKSVIHQHTNSSSIINTNIASNITPTNSRTTDTGINTDIDLDEITAIKGTVKHSWGVASSRIESQVINLNKSDNIIRDLEPPVKITVNNNNKIEDDLRSSSNKIFNDLDKKKIKNRQARIHSNDDFINMQSAKLKNNTQNSNIFINSEQIIKNESGNNSDNSNANIHELSSSEIRKSLPTITVQECKPIRNAIRDNNSDSDGDLESESDCSSGSEFSFEYAGLNGRTSSVKYYSKPEEEEEEENLNQNDRMYIDDIYTDEDFDEDMNYDNENHSEYDNKNFMEYDDANEFRKNRFTINDEFSRPIKKDINNVKNITREENNSIEDGENKVENYSDLFSLSTNKESDLRVEEEINPTKVKKYDDLFNLTDEEEEENNEEEQDKDICGDAGEDLEHGDEIMKNNDNMNIKVPDIRINNHSIGISDSPSKSANKIRSYNDLFELTDEEDHELEEEELEGGYRKHGHVNSKQSTNAGIGIFVSDGLNKKENIYSDTNFNMAKNTKTSGVSSRVTKYSDLFDLSDDENEDIDWLSNNDDQNIIKPVVKKATIPQYRRSTLSQVTNWESAGYNPNHPKPFVRSYKNIPILSDDENESELNTPFSSIVRSHSPLNSSQFTPMKTKLKQQQQQPGGLLQTPFQPSIHTSPASEPIHHIFQSLPPTARSNTLKFHDINCSLDGEVPGLSSNLYFIDETEEDEYNIQHNVSVAEQYSYDLDEINKVPEDFEFSESEVNDKFKAVKLRNNSLSPMSFRRTHSYHGKPVTVSRVATPASNRLEINNRTVTFFNNSFAPTIVPESRTPTRSPKLSPAKSTDADDITSFCKPSPDYVVGSQYSLSPIQETSSAASSPGRHIIASP